MATATAAVTQATKSLPQFQGKTKQNLFELCFQFKDFAVGKRFRRRFWSPDTFVRITKFIPTTNAQGHHRGKVWGVVTRRGQTEFKEVQIRSPLKREWSLILDEEFTETPTVSTPKTLKAEEGSSVEVPGKVEKEQNPTTPTTAKSKIIHQVLHDLRSLQ
eukprot:TRINITY_DN857_c0_g1_i1.p1 TRINITY_DN857_c0_g1~~TRINITY_DN857_c0_g1_i1.p1  ORF type:complete len:172 (+),score=48.41 TRINITY_DN857_c0_g1_i1:37-516(+)